MRIMTRLRTMRVCTRPPSFLSTVRKVSRFFRFPYLCSSAHASSRVGTHDHVADEWWSDTGSFVPLHSMNRLRVPLIRQSLLEREPPADQTQYKPSKPLIGYSVLDVGCGGGVLSEPLARLGAQVTGIDIGEASIAVAKSHAELDDEIRDNIQYECATVEELLTRDGLKFDCVVASEVVEHIPVADQRAFILNCCKLAKHSVVVTTVNQTNAAYWLGIVAAEKVFRIVPWGTHEFSMLVPPENLQDMLKEGGAGIRRLHGMCLNPVTMEWKWTNYTAINYAIEATVFPASIKEL